MRKLTFLLFVLFTIINTKGYTQVPESFNYQAVVRDDQGNLIINQHVSVRVSILENSSEGSAEYIEHQVIKSSATGVINMGIGAGIVDYGVFSDINWSANQKFLKVEIDPLGGVSYQHIGTFQLLSVPYAMEAKNSTTSVMSENAINSVYALKADSAEIAKRLDKDVLHFPETDTLFAVKDHNGNLVFAVFPDGAKVYVNEGVKGNIGGFAVTGRNPGKAIPEEEYLRVTPDSTRVWVNESLKGNIGGFAVTGRNPGKGMSGDYFVVTSDSARIYINDTTTTKGKIGGFAVTGRNPDKGPNDDYLRVTRDSTRVYITESNTKGKAGGFAVTGRNPDKAIDQDYFNITPSITAQKIIDESRVMWYPEKSALLAGELYVPEPDSVGEFSLSLGYRNIAKGKWSQAMGYQSVARGAYSTAVGFEAIADSSSFAFGFGSKALGTNSFAFGSKGVDASGNQLSTVTSAKGDYAFAFGLGASAEGLGSFVLGANSTASGDFSTALGFNTEANGLNSTAMGVGNVSQGIASFTMGAGNTATGDQSMAFGAGNIALGDASMVMGANNTANGTYCIVGGFTNTATGTGAFVIGNNNNINGDATMATGSYNVCSNLGAVAFGSHNNSGGLRSFATGYYTTSSGSNSFSSGDNTIASGSNSIAGGYYTKANANGAISYGDNTIANGQYSITAGFYTTAESYASLVCGQFNTLEGGDANNWVETDPLFIAGNGTNAGFGRNNALILYKNGNMEIAGALQQDSDERLKENIVKLDNILEKVLKINSVYYEFIDKQTHPSGTHIGFIAQEIQPYFPELINSDSKGFLSVEYSNMTAVLLQAIKEQQTIIDQQIKKNQELEDKLKRILDRLEVLEDK